MVGASWFRRFLKERQQFATGVFSVIYLMVESTPTDVTRATWARAVALLLLDYGQVLRDLLRVEFGFGGILTDIYDATDVVTNVIKMDAAGLRTLAGICNVFISVVAINTVFVVLQFRTMTFEHIWAAKLLRSFGTFCVTALFPTIFEYGVMPVSCEFWSDNGCADVTGPQHLVRVISALLATFHFLFGLVVSLYFLEIDPLDGKPLAAFTGRTEALYLLLKTSFIVTPLLPASRIPDVLILVALLSYATLAMQWYEQPFHSQITNYIRSAMYGSAAGVATSALLASHNVEHSTAAAFILGTTLAALSVAATHFRTKHLCDMATRACEQMQSQVQTDPASSSPKVERADPTSPAHKMAVMHSAGLAAESGKGEREGKGVHASSFELPPATIGSPRDPALAVGDSSPGAGAGAYDQNPTSPKPTPNMTRSAFASGSSFLFEKGMGGDSVVREHGIPDDITTRMGDSNVNLQGSHRVDDYFAAKGDKAFTKNWSDIDALVACRAMLRCKDRNTIANIERTLVSTVDNKPNARYTPLWLATFSLFVLQDHRLTHKILDALDAQSMHLDARFLRFAIRQKMAQLLQSNSLGNEMTAIGMMEASKAQETAVQFHRDAVRHIRLFWRDTVTHRDNDVMDRLDGFFSACDKAKTAFDELQQKFPESAALLRAHAQFVDDVQNDSTAAAEMRQRADQYEDLSAHVIGNVDAARSQSKASSGHHSSSVGSAEHTRQLAGGAGDWADSILSSEVASMKAATVNVQRAILVMVAFLLVGYLVTDLVLFSNAAQSSITQITFISRARDLFVDCLDRTRDLIFVTAAGGDIAKAVQELHAVKKDLNDALTTVYDHTDTQFGSGTIEFRRLSVSDRWWKYTSNPVFDEFRLTMDGMLSATEIPPELLASPEMWYNNATALMDRVMAATFNVANPLIPRMDQLAITYEFHVRMVANNVYLAIAFISVAIMVLCGFVVSIVQRTIRRASIYLRASSTITILCSFIPKKSMRTLVAHYIAKEKALAQRGADMNELEWDAEDQMFSSKEQAIRVAAANSKYENDDSDSASQCSDLLQDYVHDSKATAGTHMLDKYFMDQRQEGGPRREGKSEGAVNDKEDTSDSTVGVAEGATLPGSVAVDVKKTLVHDGPITPAQRRARGQAMSLHKANGGSSHNIVDMVSVVPGQGSGVESGAEMSCDDVDTLMDEIDRMAHGGRKGKDRSSKPRRSNKRASGVSFGGDQPIAPAPVVPGIDMDADDAHAGSDHHHVAFGGHVVKEVEMGKAMDLPQSQSSKSISLTAAQRAKNRAQWKAVLLHALLGLGLMLTFQVAVMTVSRLASGAGPTATAYQDLSVYLADILPPPAFVIENYMHTMLLTMVPTIFRQSSEDNYHRTQQNFYSRMTYWNQVFSDGTRRGWVDDIQATGTAMFAMTEERLFPAIVSGNSTAVKIAYLDVQVAWKAHLTVVRRIYDDSVQAAEDSTDNFATIEQYAQTISIVTVILCGLTLTFSIVLIHVDAQRAIAINTLDSLRIWFMQQVFKVQKSEVSVIDVESTGGGAFDDAGVTDASSSVKTTSSLSQLQIRARNKRNVETIIFTILMGIMAIVNLLMAQSQYISTVEFQDLVSLNTWIADIAPPPAYFVEGFATATEVVLFEEHPDTELFETLVSQFDERYAHWSVHRLEGRLREVFTGPAYDAGKQMTRLVLGQMMQSIGDPDALQVMWEKLYAAFGVHDAYINMCSSLAFASIDSMLSDLANLARVADAVIPASAAVLAVCFACMLWIFFDTEDVTTLRLRRIEDNDWKLKSRLSSMMRRFEANAPIYMWPVVHLAAYIVLPSLSILSVTKPLSHLDGITNIGPLINQVSRRHLYSQMAVNAVREAAFGDRLSGYDAVTMAARSTFWSNEVRSIDLAVRMGGGLNIQHGTDHTFPVVDRILYEPSDDVPLLPSEPFYSVVNSGYHHAVMSTMELIDAAASSVVAPDLPQSVPLRVENNRVEGFMTLPTLADAMWSIPDEQREVLTAVRNYVQPYLKRESAAVQAELESQFDQLFNILHFEIQLLFGVNIAFIVLFFFYGIFTKTVDRLVTEVSLLRRFVSYMPVNKLPSSSVNLMRTVFTDEE